MKNLFLLPCLIWLLTCSSPVRKPQINIEGSWKSANGCGQSYTTLNFADSTAIFDTMADTIHRFSYKLDETCSTLWLTDSFGEKRSAIILKSTKDSLVFASLWNLDTVQRFSR